jgi:LmbE family N-acetylglucosaminyl deacetylase
VANAGRNCWQEYAALRRHELQAAMCQAGVHNTRLICFGYPDQEASFHLPQIAKRLVALFRRIHPSILFTHPYEGGHPDHDACAAAVRLASLLLKKHERCPEILEFTSYHICPSGGLETERFLGHSPKLWRRRLTPQQRGMKSEILARYASQQRVLCEFPLREESIRIAPNYDFGRPPHRGKLYYEKFDWGMTGRRWRKLVRRAITALNL